MISAFLIVLILALLSAGCIYSVSLQLKGLHKVYFAIGVSADRIDHILGGISCSPISKLKLYISVLVLI